LGKIKSYNLGDGHGFITPDDGGRDIFFGLHNCEAGFIPRIYTKVEYFVRQKDKSYAGRVNAVQPATEAGRLRPKHVSTVKRERKVEEASGRVESGQPKEQGQLSEVLPAQLQEAGHVIGAQFSGTCRFWDAENGFGFLTDSKGM
jgi:cold shock CspA family protein